MLRFLIFEIMSEIVIIYKLFIKNNLFCMYFGIYKQQFHIYIKLLNKSARVLLFIMSLFDDIKINLDRFFTFENLD